MQVDKITEKHQNFGHIETFGIGRTTFWQDDCGQNWPSQQIRRKTLDSCVLLAVCLCLTGCIRAPNIVATPSACSALLPPEWQMPVPGAPLPEGETVADWISFGDQQTAQLDKANDRTVSAIGIVSRCESRDAEAVKRARKHFWEFWK